MNRRPLSISVILLLVAATLAQAQDAKSGAAAVDPQHAQMGTVFYVDDPVHRDVVTFESEAPLEDIVGTSHQITGYVVFDPEHPEKGVAGRLTVPVASLETGIPMRDEHLRSPMWLNAKAHENIQMHIHKASDVKKVKSTDSFATYSMNVEGEFMLNGMTKKLQVPATVTFLKESEQTKQRLPGDLLAGRTEFQVALADFGIQGMKGIVGSKVSETITVKVSFTASDEKPEMASK